MCRLAHRLAAASAERDRAEPRWRGAPSSQSMFPASPVGPQRSEGVRAAIQYNVMGYLRTPFFAKTRFGLIANEPDRRSPMRLALSRPRSDLRLSTASPRFGGNEASYDRPRDGCLCRLCHSRVGLRWDRRRLIRRAPRLHRLSARRLIHTTVPACATSQETRTAAWRNRLDNSLGLRSGRMANCACAGSSLPGRPAGQQLSYLGARRRSSAPRRGLRTPFPRTRSGLILKTP